MPITEPIDEDELEADLAALEQENLDEKMLKTGTVPVADSLNRLPKAANGERKSIHTHHLPHQPYPSKEKKGKEERRETRQTNDPNTNSQRQIESAGRRRRRGGRVAEAAGRDGHVKTVWRIKTSNRGGSNHFFYYTIPHRCESRKPNNLLYPPLLTSDSRRCENCNLSAHM